MSTNARCPSASMTSRLAIAAFLAVTLPAFAGLLTACGGSLAVATASPRPNVAVPPGTPTLALKMNDNVKDSFVVPEQQGIAKVEVEGWRSTLKNGFDAAFDDAGSGESQLHVVISRADLELTPAAVRGDSAVMAARAQITDRAQLVDPLGNVVANSARTAISKGIITRSKTDEVTRVVGDAVESMYELIAEDLLQGPQAATIPAAPTQQTPSAPQI